MLLTANKRAHFTIVIAADAQPAVRYAAEQLQRYVERMSFALPRIVTDDAPVGSREVLIGEGEHRKVLFPDAPVDALPKEGYLLRAEGSHLLAVGGSPRGTLYAVYELLEHMGVRWWTPWTEHVPRRMLLEVARLDVRREPPLIYRALWYRNAMDADWQARMRLNAGSMAPPYLRERHGGMERFAADMTAHTYGALVPVEKHFDRHPEYFSEVGGVRLRHNTQLCATNPEVAAIAAETAAGWLRASPGTRIVSVTQNDHGNRCMCRRCAALIAREGSPSAPALHLANEVARILAQEFPDVLVDTFAYSYTQKPPARMRAHPNVLVRIAPIGNCFGHPIRTCPANRDCLEAVEGWARAARHLFVWHYVADFFHYMAPFPNLPPLADDIQFYLAHGVKGIFLQGDGTSLGGDMAELKAYVMARLLWDPSVDADAVRQEFLAGYYREAAEAVQDCVCVFEKAFARGPRRDHLFLYRSLWENEAAYLEPPVLERARKALDRGRKKAAEDAEVLDRLDRIEAGLDYTELFYHERPAKRRLIEQRCRCSVSPRRRRLLSRFFATALRAGVTHYAEDLGRYTTMGCLRNAWLASLGSHPTIELAAGGARAVIVPALGGRIVHYGPQEDELNLLGKGSPKTFGYPCCGGYEEYSLADHQSPGFCEPYAVIERSATQAALRSELETGLTLVRRIRLDAMTREVAVASRLRNLRDVPLPGCIRAHLEIDLRTPPQRLEKWWLRRGRWQKMEGDVSGAWYEDEVPGGWAFWSPTRRLGVVQRWSASEVGAAYIGTLPSEPRTLVLDLAHARANAPVPPGGKQGLTHRFGWFREPFFEK